MKRWTKNSQKTVKGTPSAVLLSMLIHAGLFLLAGLLVIFTAIDKEPAAFEPPKAVERPKMKLKKPQVRVKKAKPSSSARVVIKTTKANMPVISLPEMGGIGDGLGNGVFSFDVAPDLGEVSLVGSTLSIGSDFEGTFYDCKRSRSGGLVSMSDEEFITVIERFQLGGWKTSSLSRYYRSPQKLYATCFMVPPVRSSVAPAAFNEPDTVGYAWLVLYNGQLVHKDGIKFRFWGNADDVLLVRVDGKLVLNASHPDHAGLLGDKWRSSSADNNKYYMGSNRSYVGDWITLEPGVPRDMEVLISEIPGGDFFAMLCVEVEGVEYERSRQGAPILPMFKTAPPSASLIDVISEHLVEGEASITNGPVFCDYSTERVKPEVNMTEPQESGVDGGTVKADDKIRLWSFSDGNTVEAEYLSAVADYVVLRDSKGKQRKIPLDTLSVEDREYIELENVPKFNVDFINKEDSVIGRYTLSPKEIEWNVFPPVVNDYTFGASIKQIGAKTYNHEIYIEYYSLGQQVLDSNKYVLLDHQVGSFVPSKDNDRSYRITGKPIELVQFNLSDQQRGIKYAEYLVLVKDKRGKIIEYSTSANWLWENLESLRNVPVGRYIDKKCRLTVASGPKNNNY